MNVGEYLHTDLGQPYFGELQLSQLHLDQIHLDESQLAILLAALVIDALVGDPARLYRRVPHPVVLIGKLIGWLERVFNRTQWSRVQRIISGAFVSAGTIAFVYAIAVILQQACLALFSGDSNYVALGIQAALVSTLLAARGLHDYVRAVALALAQGSRQGRTAVAHIVGRDPEQLDEPAIARAAVESLAENFSDGVVAPVFWFVCLGFPGLVVYKTINTLDSMIGHRNEQYEAFGKVAARVDDVANAIPARLAGLLVCIAALLVPDASAKQAMVVMLRDASRHKSPSAGWQEAAFAGALGIALAGPRQYGATLVEDGWMGHGRADLDANDIRRALRLFIVANAVLWLAVIALVLAPAFALA